jgi:hypothetical protein
MLPPKFYAHHKELKFKMGFPNAVDISLVQPQLLQQELSELVRFSDY